jgi:hypothetical protein
MNPDFVELLRAFNVADVRFLVVGAYAVTFHTRPRATADLDLWVEPTLENAPKVIQALTAFGAPLDEIAESDFAQPGITFQIDVAPRRIDMLTELSGLGFDQAWPDRVQAELGGCPVCFIGRQALIQNKRATGRPKDLVDLEVLEDV